MSELAKAYVQIIPSSQGMAGAITEIMGGEAQSAGERAGSDFSNAMAGAIKAAGTVITAAIGTVTAAGVASVRALVSETAAMAEYGDNIDKASQQMGISAQAYQEWEAVMEHSGTSMESLRSSMRTMAAEAEKNSEAFAALGISEEAVANLSQEDLFAEVIAGLQNLDEGTERTYLASQLLGRGAVELGALLNTSAEDTQAMKDRVHELGGVMSDEAVAAAAAYQDSLQDMMTGFDGLKRSMLSDFMPAFTEVMDGVTELLAGNTAEGLEMLSAGVETVASGLVALVPQLFEVGGSLLGTLAEVVIANLPQVIDAGMQVVAALGQGLLDNMDMIIDATVEIIKQIGGGIVEALPALAEGAVRIITELTGVLTEMLPELLPAATQMIVELVNGLIRNIPLLINAALQLISAFAQGMIAALPVLIRALPELLRNLVDAMKGSLGMIIESTIELVTMIADAMPEIITILTEILPDLIDIVVDAFLELLPVFIDGAIQMTVAIAEHLPEIIAALVDALPQIVDAIVAGLGGLIAGVLGLFDRLFDAVGKAISEWWNGLKTDIKSGFESFLNDFKEWLENLPYNLGVALGNMILKFKEWKDDAIQWVTTELPEIISNILNFFEELPGNIWEFFTQIVTDLGTWADEMINMIRTEVPKIIDDIAGFFEELPAKALQWGKDLIDSFIAGIRQMWDDAMGVFEDFAQGVQDIIGFSEPKKGPLSNFHTYAPDMMELFAQGVTDNKALVQGTVEDAFNLREAVTGGAVEAVPNGSSLIQPTAGRSMTVILELDRTQLGKTVYQLNNAEMQRVGVSLAGGYGV